MEKKWWHETVIYQIYPRSFSDSNHDGIGDLQGIIAKLPYLAKLGIGAIWLSPVYASPNDDNGYDISDYRAIAPEYGTMADMDALIAAAKQHEIAIIMDLVVNHTSDEHPWFQAARQSKENPYRDYYIWRPNHGALPNGLRSTFSGSAWELDPLTDEYYLHLFSKKQPDLNWENKEVRQEIYAMMNFWLAKGIGGFRMDVIDLIGKDPDLEITANGKQLHPYLQEMNRATFGNYDVLTVGETWGVTPEGALLYTDPSRNELSMVFQFEHAALDEQPGKEKWDLKAWDFLKLKAIFSKWQTELDARGWNSLFWNNHDLPRAVSRLGNDTAAYREVSAKMLATILHLQKGTPYIYQGEEIGLTNTAVSSIAEVDDIESRNMYRERLAAGYDEQELLQAINAKGRDNARRPIPWNAQENGGFTIGSPWLALNPNYDEINVEAALEDKDSLFYYYQTLIRLRKENSLIVWGSYQELLPNHPAVYAYLREYEGEKWLVVANFYEAETTCELPFYQVKKIILSNYPASKTDLADLHLRPYEAVVYQVE